MQIHVKRFGEVKDNNTLISADPTYTLDGCCSLANAINAGACNLDVVSWCNKEDYCFVPGSAIVLVQVEE